MSKLGYAILVDLGNMKACEIHKSEQNNVSLQAYQSTDNLDSHAKTSDLVSDKAGENANSVTGSNSSYESKNDLEIKSRSIDAIGDYINEFAAEHDGKLYISVSEPIHAKVEEKFSASTKSKITKLLAKNLTQQSSNNVIKAFEL